MNFVGLKIDDGGYEETRSKDSWVRNSSSSGTPGTRDSEETMGSVHRGKTVVRNKTVYTKR